MQKDELNPDLEQEEETEEEDIDLDLDEDEEDESDDDWKAKALKFQAIAGRLKKKLDSSQNTPTQEKKPEPKKDEEEPNAFATMKEVALVTKELDSDELEELELQAKEIGIDPVKFARTPVWKSHLVSFRSEKQKSRSSLSPSQRNSSKGDSDYRKVISSEKSTLSEKQKAFEKKRDALLGK